MSGGVLTAAIQVRTGVIQVRFECDSSVIRVPPQRFMAHGRAYELMFGVIQPSPLGPFIILKGKREQKRHQKVVLARCAESLLEFYHALCRESSRILPRLVLLLVARTAAAKSKAPLVPV